MSATLGGGVGPKVAQLLAQALPQQYGAVGVAQLRAQALPQQYGAVGVAQAGLSPAQEDAEHWPAAPAEHILTSAGKAGGVAAPFLVSQGRSFRVRTEYLGLPGGATGESALGAQL